MGQRVLAPSLMEQLDDLNITPLLKDGNGWSWRYIELLRCFETLNVAQQVRLLDMVSELHSTGEVSLLLDLLSTVTRLLLPTSKPQVHAVNATDVPGVYIVEPSIVPLAVVTVGEDGIPALCVRRGGWREDHGRRPCRHKLIVVLYFLGDYGAPLR
jgi:hypothetical protein